MDEAIEREFRSGFERAGLAVPAERYDMMLEAYAGYRALAALLHGTALPPGIEPAGLCVLEPDAGAQR